MIDNRKKLNSEKNSSFFKNFMPSSENFFTNKTNKGIIDKSKSLNSSKTPKKSNLRLVSLDLPIS